MSESKYLTEDELKILMRKHKNTPKERDLKKQYKILWRLETIQVNQNAVSDIKDISRQMLTQMGYSNIYLYTEDSFNIIDRITNDIGLLYGRGYTQETISYGIVTEVLDYYDSKILDLLDDYNIDSIAYMTIKSVIHDWCKQNYWKPKITAS